MEGAWGVLKAAGVPDGPARPVPERLDVGAVREALTRVGAVVDRLGEQRRDALLAWLCAFRHHWPSEFLELLGSEAGSLESRLHGEPLDADRHLKLRRIAIENLARLV